MKTILILTIIILVLLSCEDPGKIKCDITPSPTPEPAPEVTPEPTPDTPSTPVPEPTLEPTPDITPEPTPEPTPEVTPETTPEVTPEPTPDTPSTPTPEPALEPTPDITPEPTPEPTPDPPEPTPLITPEPTPDPAPETPEPTPEFSPVPTPVSTSAPTPTHLSPPGNVNAAITSDFIHVTWDLIPYADHYEVYRKTGTGDFISVTETLVSTNAWDDTGFPRDIPLSYAVKSERNGEFSDLSGPSNTIVVQSGASSVQNTRVSVLEYKENIFLNWDPVPGADSYRVYRYTARDPLSLVSAWETIDNVYNEADSILDTFVPDINRPYFFKVSWMDDGLEYSPPDDYSFGLCSDAIDPFEPDNNDYQYLTDSPSSVFDPLNPPVIYSMPDSAGGCMKDTDWYKYRGEPQFINVEVALDKGWDSAFLAREDINLYFLFFYNGQEGITHNIIMETSNFYFEQGDFGEVTGEADLYYKLFAEAPPGENIIESYRVSVTHSY